MKERLETLERVIGEYIQNVTIIPAGDYFFVTNLQNIKKVNDIINPMLTVIPGEKKLVGMDVTISTYKEINDTTLDRSIRFTPILNTACKVLISRNGIAINEQVLCKNSLYDNEFNSLIQNIIEHMKMHTISCIPGSTFSFDGYHDIMKVESYVQDYGNKRNILTITNLNGTNKQNILLPWFRRDPLDI